MLESVVRAASKVNGHNKSDIVKVSATSRPSAVAGAIAGVMREEQRVEVQAIGAGAVNQAVKAIAVARQYLADDSIGIVCVPQFFEIEIDGLERTCIRFNIEPRPQQVL